MPSGGSRPNTGGARPGAGHPPGPRKSTIEREQLAQQELEARERVVAARVLDEARAFGGKPLAREVLEEVMLVAKNAMALHQPVTAEMVKMMAERGQKADVRDGSWPLFGDWWDRTAYAAKELAKYQSPQLRAIMVAPPPTEATEDEVERMFTLTVFEGGRPVRRVDQNGDDKNVDDVG